MKMLVFGKNIVLKFSCIAFLVLVTMQITEAQPNNIKANGYNIFYYPNKTISAEGNFKDGKPIGYWKSYYPTGILKTEGNRKNDLLDSLWKFYDEKSHLKEQIYYRNGVKSGYNSIYIFSEETKKSILISKELYVEGKLNGKSFYYDSTATLTHTIEYDNGYLHGFEKHYDKTGLLNLILRYSHNNLTDSEYINRRGKFGMKQGVWKEFYENERIKTYTNYLNDTINGYYREYDKYGNITKTEFYRNGKLFVQQENGESSFEQKEIKKEFYANGVVKSVGAFKDNVKVGTHVYYDSVGNIENAVIYSPHGIVTAEGMTDSKGFKQDKWNYLYPDGKIKSSGEYKNNKRVGDWVFLYPNGIKEQFGKYKNGKVTGVWTWYYSNSKIRRKGKFVKGLEEGLFYELTKLGDTLSVGEYVGGLKHGKWKYNINEHLEIGNYSFGKRSGIWTYFYPDNIKEFEGNYIEGYEDGNHKYYYANKRLKLSAYFSGGIKTKKWKYYEPYGSIRTVIEYRGGKKYSIDGDKIKDK